jgi:hypothetical protein
VVERKLTAQSVVLYLILLKSAARKNLDAETKGNKLKRKNKQDKESTVMYYYYFIK